MPSYQHEKAVVDYLAELTKQGWKTINLKGRSPDGIAVKDNEIVAVEVLIKNPDDGKCCRTDAQKRSNYFMFDGVYIRKIDRNTDIAPEDKRYMVARKKRDEEKINEMWDKYD